MVGQLVDYQMRSFFSKSGSDNKLYTNHNTKTGEFETVAKDVSVVEEEVAQIRERVDLQNNLLEEVTASVRDIRNNITQPDTEMMETITQLKQSVESLKQQLEVALNPKPVAEPQWSEPIKDSDMLYAVVLTVSRTSTDGRNKSPQEIRERIMKWVRNHIKSNNITVASGPWLDDNADMNHPHVNMTVVGDPSVGDKFGTWAQRKGYVHSSPVMSPNNWETYATRNHEACVMLRDKQISAEQAGLLMKGKIKLPGPYDPTQMNFTRPDKIHVPITSLPTHIGVTLQPTKLKQVDIEE